jgi:hypothetical protein
MTWNRRVKMSEDTAATVAGVLMGLVLWPLVWALMWATEALTTN